MRHSLALARSRAGILAIASAMLAMTLCAVPADAQTLPHVSVPVPIVGGVVVPQPPVVALIPGSSPTSTHRGGSWQESGRADVDLDVSRSRDRGHALVR